MAEKTFFIIADRDGDLVYDVDGKRRKFDTRDEAVTAARDKARDCEADIYVLQAVKRVELPKSPLVEIDLAG